MNGREERKTSISGNFMPYLIVKDYDKETQ